MATSPRWFPSSAARALVHPGAVAAFAVGASAWTAAHDPERYPGRFPPCAFRAVTGLECPSCGGTRMAHHLLRGRWCSALRANPVLLTIGLPLLGWLWLRWMAAVRRGEQPKPVPRSVALAALIVAVTWAALRNTRPVRNVLRLR